MKSVLVVNILIVITILLIAIILNQPLAIIGLFWVQPFPHGLQDNDNNDNDNDNDDGDDSVDGEYEEQNIGFNAEIK